MGKIEYLVIELDKPNPIYFGEETIHGTLRLRVKERFKINRIFLTIVGGARVHWTERRKSGKTTYTVNYNGYEKYMEHIINLMTKEPNQDLYLEFGDYNLRFQIQLPARLPTSFEHAIGKIRYSLHGCVDIPWSFNKRTEKPFTVLSDLDLNERPTLRLPYGVTDSKVLCCGPCKSQPIIAKFDIKKCGYVSGETIFFNVSIENKSNREIKIMNFSIVQIIKFHATTKTKTCQRTMATIKYIGLIPGGGYETWSGSLAIPPLISTSNGFCRIIDVQYMAQLDFSPSGTLLSKYLYIPIVIGTKPLIDQSEISNQSTNDNYLPSYEACTQDASDTLPMLPPEYSKNNDEVYNQSDANQFRPLYPYFSDFSNIGKRY